MNPIGPEDVFALAPGQTVEFGEWLGEPWWLSSRTHRVVFYYTNAPGREFRRDGEPRMDATTARRLRASTPCALVSNEVIVRRP